MSQVMSSARLCSHSPVARKPAGPGAHTAKEQRLHDLQRIIDAVAATGDLHPTLDTGTAADIRWTIGSPEAHQQLTVDRGWSNDDYRRWLTTTIQALLLR